MIKVIERPGIELEEMEFLFTTENNFETKIDEAANDIGRTPLIKIGGHIIEGSSIIYLNLYNDQFLPRISMRFKDTTNRLLDALFPIDNTLVKTFIQSSNDELMPIRMDFKITKFNPIKSKGGDNNDILIDLEGILNVDNLYKTPYKSYDKTTFEILKEIAKDSLLGFSSNIEDTDDKMVWINPSEKNMDFIQNMVKLSFKTIDTFLYSYVDFYYNLNYIDIELALSESIEGQKHFTGSKFLHNEKLNPKPLQDIQDLVLLNHPENIESNFYINKYNVENRSTATNLDIGYVYYQSYYDVQGNTIYDLKLDSITTPGPDGSSIIMKGGLGKITDIENELVINEYDGKIDTDNVHKYYLYAYRTNQRNLIYLEKVKMKISIKSANFNLYRFQKVTVRLFNISEFNKEKEKGKTTVSGSSFGGKRDSEKMNERLSGDWLISSINYKYGLSGEFEQEVVLVKRELSFNYVDFNPNKTY